MNYLLVASFLLLTSCAALPTAPNPPNQPNEPTAPDGTAYRVGTCSVDIQFEAFTGTVTGQARYTYKLESPLKDLHFVECYIDMVRVGNVIIDSVWRYYIRSDILTEGVEGTFERVEGKSDDLAYLNSFNLIDYDTTKRTSYYFLTPNYRTTVTVQQDSSGFKGSFSETGNFGNRTLTNKAATITATFSGK